MLTIETEGNYLSYLPGATLRGRCGWQLSAIPKDAVLRLFWYTEGRGTQDVGVVAEQQFIVQASNQQESFEFQVPETPYSFRGSLIALQWALELIVDRGKEVTRLDLLISPWETEVVLQAVPEETRPFMQMQ